MLMKGTSRAKNGHDTSVSFTWRDGAGRRVRVITASQTSQKSKGIVA